MKLPGPTYDVGVSPLGRENPQDPLELGRQQFIAVSSGGKGEAFLSLAKVAQHWLETEDAVRARRSFAGYKQLTTDAETLLKKSQIIDLDSLPEGFDYQRAGIAAQDPDNPEDPEMQRTARPWEVAPEYYAAVSANAAKAAMKGIRTPEARAWLENKIADARISEQQSINEFHLTERKRNLAADTFEAVRMFVKAGDYAEALSSVDSAIREGTLPLKEGNELKIKVRNESAGIVATQFIDTTENPMDLEHFAGEIISVKGDLSDEQARMFADRARAKGEKILTKSNHVKDNASKVILAEQTQLIVTQKKHYSPEALDELQKEMVPSDFISLVHEIRTQKNADKESGFDTAPVRRLQGQIVGLSHASGTLTVTARMQVAHEAINNAYVKGELNSTDRDKLHADVVTFGDRATVKDPKYADAEKLLQENLFPRSTIVQIGTAVPFAAAIAEDAKIDLFNAKNANPDLDPLAWVKKNLHIYQSRTVSKAIQKVYEVGAGAHLKYDPSGRLDVAATKKTLQEAWKGGYIYERDFKAAIDALTQTIPVPPEKVR